MQFGLDRHCRVICPRSQYARVSAAGKCAGMLALAPEDEEVYAAMGARYFARVATGIISKALKDSAQGGKNQLDY